jgi:hypothetical protein
MNCKNDVLLIPKKICSIIAWIIKQNKQQQKQTTTKGDSIHWNKKNDIRTTRAGRSNGRMPIII